MSKRNAKRRKIEAADSTTFKSLPLLHTRPTKIVAIKQHCSGKYKSQAISNKRLTTLL